MRLTAGSIYTLLSRRLGAALVTIVAILGGVGIGDALQVAEPGRSQAQRPVVQPAASTDRPRGDPSDGVALFTQDERARARDSLNRARDSVKAHRAAHDAVKMHHYRFGLLIDPPGLLYPWMQPSDFSCEMSVWPYCFGPMNGDVPFGQARKAFSVEFRTWDPMVPDFLRRTVGRLVTTLIRALDDAAARVPGDRWVVGQQVFQRVQNGNLHGAQSVAKTCRADRWWCAALVGYTSYLLGQHAVADSAFAASLAALDGPERCKREDFGDLLYGDGDRDWYVRLSCDERVDVNRTVWWLTDPLFVTPGNERFTAHFYRDVFRQLFVDSNEELPTYTGSSFFDPGSLDAAGIGRVTVHGGVTLNLAHTLACTMFEREVWEQGALESLIRSLGVPSYFMLQRYPDDFRCPEFPLFPGSAGSGIPPMPKHNPQILLQYPQPTYHFVPAMAAVRDPMKATMAMWQFFDSNAVERYKPSFGTFSLLEYQVAFFRRGDSARVVAAADLGATGLTSGRNQLVASALVLSRGPDDIRIVRNSIPGTNITFLSGAKPESTIVSLETLVTGVGAARARFASGPPSMPAQRVTLSDILLLDTPDTLPRSLEAAAARARPNSISPAAPIGLYWEVYGLAAGDTVTFALSASEGGRSIATSLGRVLGVVRDARRASVVWGEQLSSAEPVAPRHLMLDLSSLSEGKYTLALEVLVPGQDTVRVRRDIDIVRQR